MVENAENIQLSPCIQIRKIQAPRGISSHAPIEVFLEVMSFHKGKNVESGDPENRQISQKKRKERYKEVNIPKKHELYQLNSHVCGTLKQLITNHH